MRMIKAGLLAVLQFWLAIAVSAALMWWLPGGLGFMIAVGLFVSLFIYSIASTP